MSKIIHGVDKTALKSIISPLFMDQTHLKRIPYGSNATSLYKRITTFSITNQFRNLSTDAAYFSPRMAFIYSPLGNICTCVPLDDNYRVTSQGTIPAGAVTLTQLQRSQQAFNMPFEGLPTILQYRIVGSQINSTFQGNFVNV